MYGVLGVQGVSVHAAARKVFIRGFRVQAVYVLAAARKGVCSGVWSCPAKGGLVGFGESRDCCLAQRQISGPIPEASKAVSGQS